MAAPRLRRSNAHRRSVGAQAGEGEGRGREHDLVMVEQARPLRLASKPRLASGGRAPDTDDLHAFRVYLIEKHIPSAFEWQAPDDSSSHLLVHFARFRRRAQCPKCGIKL